MNSNTKCSYSNETISEECFRSITGKHYFNVTFPWNFRRLVFTYASLKTRNKRFFKNALIFEKITIHRFQKSGFLRMQTNRSEITIKISVFLQNTLKIGVDKYGYIWWC